ncbi:HAMP domain-containing histidine kinase [Acidaminobacter sp. JC074]|uniref:sensor histidine kinase n=1 Tax=Acidaminobacter sp. JC074 TaxID=2530199 RepID=UPI001F109386|nr:HAMP domain-containing sensor histidine kinase [Acidaminobacter sp. JC074]MCH4886389.1 HAMP domain-containing histidine kinase [Acidaminobacter sp. JC074]
MKTKKGSKLFSVMLKEFAVFVIISIVIISIIVVSVFYFAFIAKEKFFKEPYASNSDWFDSGQYDKLDIEKEYGQGSHFYVFDEYFKIVYQSNDDIEYPYSEDQTYLIPDELDDLTTSWIESDQGRLYKIEFKEMTGDIKTLVIVDDTRQVIYSNRGIEGKMDEDTFDCLYGENENFEMIKQVFYVNDQKHLAVFMFPTEINEYLLGEMIVIILAILLIIILSALLSLYLYLKRLNKKVIKPIEVLEENMLNFDVEDSQIPMTYNGPLEFKNIFSRFYEMAGRLKEAQDNNQKMIADISHDLKTPISVVQLYTKLLSEEEVSDKEKEEMMQKIVTKTDEMSELINLFSEYSKLFHSDLKFEMVSCDIVDYSREYLINKYNELDTLGYELDIDLPEDKIEVSLDLMNFKRIYDNIIGNSLKYNDKGAKIFFSIKEVGSHVVITLGDNGVGIEKAIREKVFEAFIIGNDARTTGSGTGLGMAIVKKIVDLHDGQVGLLKEDETDLSVAIQIELPLF